MCGWPVDGEEVETSMGTLCIKDGHSYNAEEKSYVGPIHSEIQCPSGSVKKESVCCKGEYTYNYKTYTWDKIDAYCGCPDGGKPSKQFLKDKYTHPCCKGEYMYNPKTKRYDKKNRLACDLKETQKLVESYAKSLLKYGNESGLEPFVKASKENPDFMRDRMEIEELYEGGAF